MNPVVAIMRRHIVISMLGLELVPESELNYLPELGAKYAPTQGIRVKVSSAW